MRYPSFCNCLAFVGLLVFVLSCSTDTQETIAGTEEFSGITFKIKASESNAFLIEIRGNGLDGEVLASKEFDLSNGNNVFTSLSIPIGNLKEIENLFFLISQKNGTTLEIDNFKFYN